MKPSDCANAVHSGTHGLEVISVILASVIQAEFFIQCMAQREKQRKSVIHSLREEVAEMDI